MTPDDNNKLTPEKIRFLQHWLHRQEVLIGASYTLAALMLVCAAGAAHEHDIKQTLIFGGIGFYDCILGDKMRKKYTEVKQIFSEYQKRKNQK